MKSSLIVITAATLIICTACIGTSVAFFADISYVEKDFFSIGERGISAELTESGWDFEKGLTMLPNESMSGNLQITNTSTIDADIFVALRIEFVYGADCPDETKREMLLSDEDMACVSDVYRIDWNADNMELGDWVRFDEEDSDCQVQQFYYSAVLKRNFPEKGDVTTPLFTQICIPENISDESYCHIQSMGGFCIRISGIILQRMTGEMEFGMHSAQEAYDAGLFDFIAKEKSQKDTRNNP